jgi:uncharacterized protein (TIGR02265 family)
MSVTERDFVEPPWRAPLDPAAVLRGIPASATIAGMYAATIADDAKALGKTLTLPRERYLPFGFYPLQEYAKLLVDACTLIYPTRPMRIGLRSMGRAAPAALLRSTLGRVVLGSVHGVHEVIESVLKTYPINVRPSHAEIVERSDRHAVVHLRDIFFFLDCHHVGVLEGTLRHAGVNGQVRIMTKSPTEAYLLCSWEKAA